MSAATASARWISAGLLSATIAIALLPNTGMAQEMDHSKMQMPADQPAPAPAPKPSNSAPVAAPMDDMEMAAPEQAPVDHSAMGKSMDAMPDEPMSAMDHAAMGGDRPPAPSEPRTPIPVPTAADRIAAFPPVAEEAVHDNSIQYFVLLDRLEGWDADPGTAYAWEGLGWIGTDLNRLWLRSDGEGNDSGVELGTLEVLYGYSYAPWWDVVAGVRQDIGEDPSQTFAAVGVQGFTPYKFDVEATAYIGQSGQTSARFEADYDTLFTNKLILQWQTEVNLFGQDDAARGIGSGLSKLEAGVRLRYEFTRKFAPYIGIAYERVFGGTADLRRAEGAAVNDTRVIAGLRLWF